MKHETVVVTRHKGLAEYLIGKGFVDPDVPVIEHATIESVRDKLVVGVLPMHLAVHAWRVVEVPMDIPAELRGVELTAEQTAQYAGSPRAYSVQQALDLDGIARDYEASGYTRWTINIPGCSIGDGTEVPIGDAWGTLAEALALAVVYSETTATGETVVNPTNERGGMSLPPVGAVRGKVKTLGFRPSVTFPAREVSR